MFDYFVLSAYGNGHGNIGDNIADHGITVTLSGILIVFAMLVVLVLVISVFGFIMSKMICGGKPKEAPKAKVKAEPQKVTPQPIISSATVISEDEEVIAAISAAVMMMYEGTGKTPVIRSILPAARGARSAWANAGILNNTRPF